MEENIPQLHLRKGQIVSYTESNQNKMKVCIAEKPSVAREIASILGANQRHDGYFEGNGYQITWTFGHLCTLYTPDDYKPHWKRWDLNTLPMLPDKFDTKLVGNSGVQKQFNTIKKLFDQASLVINCGDAGQEGELIQRWVIKQANYTGKVSRLWISSLTSEAIKEGFENLKNSEDYDNLYYAGSSRAIGDWLLGMNATRLYTLRYGAAKQVLSVGRVQTPTLAMLVKRYKEILHFKSAPYWEIQTLYRDTVFNNEQGRFLNKEDSQITTSASRWSTQWMPPGFVMASHKLVDNQGQESMMFTDGLAVFSVFIDIDKARSLPAIEANLGATVAVLTKAEINNQEYAICVVGEIPRATASQIASAISMSSPPPPSSPASSSPSPSPLTSKSPLP